VRTNLGVLGSKANKKQLTENMTTAEVGNNLTVAQSVKQVAGKTSKKKGKKKGEKDRDRLLRQLNGGQGVDVELASRPSKKLRDAE